MRSSRSFEFELTETHKHAVLRWAQKFEHLVWLDSNGHADKYSNYDAALAVGNQTTVFRDLTELQTYLSGDHDWLFGYFSYDLKNELESLRSDNFDGLSFPLLYFFIPEKIWLFKEGRLELRYLPNCAADMEQDVKSVRYRIDDVVKKSPSTNVKIKLRIHKDAYFERVKRLLDHIHRGDVYEVNFCQECYASDTKIDPLGTYLKLNAISKPPFATFSKIKQHYLLSASPERYLAKRGNQVISQPIKGTAARSSDPNEDLMLKTQLKNDPKERAENIMITDLVRNDLSKIAKRGSVIVEELCEVYAYEQVYQMISTISGVSKEGLNLLEIIKHTFPMGSMTGAPKIRAMQLIEQYEATKRGIYSGTVGYISPESNFDFNVIIRSILYNEDQSYVSYSVGSAITAKSIIEKEYQECLLKAKAMRKVLET